MFIRQKYTWSPSGFNGHIKIKKLVETLCWLFLSQLTLSGIGYAEEKKALEFSQACSNAFQNQSMAEARQLCLLKKKAAEELDLGSQVIAIIKVLIKIELKTENHQNIPALFQQQSIWATNKQLKYSLARQQARYYYHLGNFVEAEKYFVEGFLLAKQLDNPVYLSKSYNDIGLVHFRKLEYKDAILNYEKSLSIKERLNRNKDAGVTLNNIGLIYYRLHEYPKSLKYYLEAFEKYQKALQEKPDSKLLGKKLTHIKTDLSAVYLQLGERKQSVEMLKSVFSDIELSQSNNEKVARLTDLAEGLLGNNEYELASAILQKAESYINDGSGRHAKLLLYLAEAESKLENWSKSKQYILAAIEKAKKYQDNLVLLRAYGLLSQIHLNEQDFEQAFNYLQKHETINREDAKNKYANDLRQVKYEFETERTEKELLAKEVALLSSENSNYQLTILIYFFVALIAFTSVIFYYRISLNKQRRKHLLAELEKHKRLLIELDKPLVNFRQLFESTEESIVVCTEAGYLIYTNILSLKNKSDKAALSLRELSTDLSVAFDEATRTEIEFDMDEQSFEFLEQKHKVKVVPILNSEYIVFQFYREVSRLFDVSGKLNLINRFSRSLNSLDVDKNDTAAMRPLVVDVMELCVKTWIRITGSNKVEFAEQSQIWKVNIDSGRLRTRSLDKYLALNTLPKQPRLKNVIKSCHFMLSQQKLNSSERELIEGYLSRIVEFEDN